MTIPILLQELQSALPANFQADDVLGKGGQGHVYKGRCDGRAAAIKVFDPSAEEKRLIREIQLLLKMDHPSLVKALGVCTVNLQGSPCCVVAYELHTGGDLRAAVANGLDEATLNQLGQQVGGALDALWKQRIVHRDVKPDNIVRAADGRFVLVDVGLARHLDRSAITGVGMAAGTRGYMSPEQAKGRRALTIQSDAFSFGVTLYELAAKQHPFRGNQNLAEAGGWPELKQVVAVSEKFSRVVASMTRPQASVRPSRLEELFL